MTAVNVVVATGGMGMVHSVYSSGKPSSGVSVGSVQAILDEHIDYNEATGAITRGRIFDNGIIRSDEQCLIHPEQHKEEIFQAFKGHGAHFVLAEEYGKVVNTLFVNDTISRDVVGKSVKHIAQLVGISMSEDIRMLIVPAKGVGTAGPICKEKVYPVMTCLLYKHFDEAAELANTNLKMEGSDHTAGIRSNNQGNITEADDKIAVSCFVVNAPCSITVGGSIQNGLSVITTLGCDSWGNNFISENLTYRRLLNISRIARASPHAHVLTDEEIWTVN